MVCLLFFFIATKITAQSASVEKSIWGIQTGILGIWANNEHGLSKTIALRTEIGFDSPCLELIQIPITAIMF